jgi:hypothetical protein
MRTEARELGRAGVLPSFERERGEGVISGLVQYFDVGVVPPSSALAAKLRFWQFQLLVYN